MPAGGVTDADHRDGARVHAEHELVELLDRGAHVVEGLGVAATPARAATDAAVLDGPGRPPLLDQARHQRTGVLDAVGGLPEPAVHHHRHPARDTRGQRQLTELARVAAVVVALRLAHSLGHGWHLLGADAPADQHGQADSGRPQGREREEGTTGHPGHAGGSAPRGGSDGSRRPGVGIRTSRRTGHASPRRDASWHRDAAAGSRGSASWRGASPAAAPAARRTSVASRSRAARRLASWVRCSDAATVSTPSTSRPASWSSTRRRTWSGRAEPAASHTSSTRESVVFTPWPPGPEDRLNRSLSSDPGITRVRVTGRSSGTGPSSGARGRFHHPGGETGACRPELRETRGSFTTRVVKLPALSPGLRAAWPSRPSGPRAAGARRAPAGPRSRRRWCPAAQRVRRGARRGRSAGRPPTPAR